MNGSIKPAKIADAIADHLERLILEGVLRPGEKLLSERDLAVKLDVSRPSLRDALSLLEERGLLVTGRSGTHIAEFLSPLFAPLASLFQADANSSFHYLEFRAAIEASAAELAAQRATDLDRAAIHRALTRMTDAYSEDDPRNEADADADLHLAIYEAAHNLVLLHIMRALSGLLHSDVFYTRRRLYERDGVRDLLLDQHVALANAVLSGDPVAARAAAEAHIAFTRSTLLAIREEDSRRATALRRIEREDLVDGLV